MHPFFRGFVTLTVFNVAKTILLLNVVLQSPLAANEPTTTLAEHPGLVYAHAEDIELKLDLYVPHGVVSPPLVVWIHGGGWRGGNRANPKLKAVTRHGFALASISYRFTDKAIFPAQIHDCKAAIRWLRAHETTYGYDASWIAVAGSSAGGHLALLVGASGDVKELEGNLGEHLDQSSRVQAIIDYFGPSDFVLRGKTQPQRAYTNRSGSLALLGGTPEKKPSTETERFASPAHYVSDDDPPLLIFHGDKDETVLLDQSEHMLKVYRESELPAELIVLKGKGHGGAAFFQGESLDKAIEFLKRFRR